MGVLHKHRGNRGPDLTNVANRLAPEQITIRILNGGNLTPDELNAIMAFLRSRQ